ncbi:MAG: hypothetical protein ACW98D_05295 [Promethearchaeota archaeon]|jgi:hypothetical protein
MTSIPNLFLVLSASITGFFVGIGGIITFLYAIIQKKRLLFLFSAMWCLYAVFWFLDAFAHLLYSDFLMAIAIIPQLIGVPCIIIFIELIRKENVSPVKITILSVIELSLLIVTFLPGGREIIPGYGVHNKGLLRIFQIIFLLYFVSLYFIWTFQTWKRAPLELKRLVSLLLLGSTLFSIVTALSYALGSILRIFNAIAFLINGIGALITIIVILIEPKIIYILPFKAYRIFVIDTDKGTALYRYDFAKLKEVEENMFSSFLQAVGDILDEILKKGEVREIQMDRAVLLIQNDIRYPIALVLIATRSTKSLRYGLNDFYDQFISNFYHEGDDFYDISKFREADNLIDKIFDFVPKYENKS